MAQSVVKRLGLQPKIQETRDSPRDAPGETKFGFTQQSNLSSW